MSGRHGNGGKWINWEILGGESRALENGLDVGHGREESRTLPTCGLNHWGNSDALC